MKREKLKTKRRRSQYDEHGVKTRPRTFVYQPSARIQRKQVINELRDLPVEALSPHPQQIEMINVHQDLFDSDGNPAVSAISFVTKRGTVHLTVNAQSFHRLYKLLHDNFGPVAEPKRKRTSNTLDVQRG